jgi:hypothetical protein
VILAAAHGPSTLWYATRGAGAVTLALLTLSVVLGIGEFRMWANAGLSRFSIGALHRFVSLLALVFLAIHVLTVWIDPFPRIGLVNAVVPFQTSYRSLWLAFGTIACDLLLAVVVTSLVRMRLGYRPWRAVHMLAYAAWPVALLHGLGAGSDTRSTWMLALTVACVASVLVAGATRIAAPAITPARRLTIGATAGVALVGLAVFTLQGPLANGWARRAGTPTSVLAAFSSAPVRARSVGVVPRTRAPRVDPLAKPFLARVSGEIRNGVSAGGTSVVDVDLRLSGARNGRLRLRLGGQSLPDGGLRMQRSAVSLGTVHDPGRYQGRVDFLEGTRIRALVGGGGHAIRLLLALDLNPPGVSGSVRAIPVTRQ